MLQMLHLKSVLSQLCSLCSDLPERGGTGTKSPLHLWHHAGHSVTPGATHFDLMYLKVLFFTATIYCHQKMPDLKEGGCMAAICSEDTAHFNFIFILF